MVDEARHEAEAERLEQLWGGSFGDEYVDRNNEFDHVAPFWRERLRTLDCQWVLEVGCNVGGNLQWIAEAIAPRHLYGVDINEKALQQLTRRVPGVNAVWSPARELPFRDRWFDLVFTIGVLIHQPDATLPLVMAEMVRCSRRWILCGEYFGAEEAEVPYRGHQGALFRRDYGGLFQELFPDLTLREQGFIGKDQGWDDVTWWLFERR
jgi:pseudaminic acid biosynthesis-associated methylase